jgi:hypothetical protein
MKTNNQFIVQGKSGHGSKRHTTWPERKVIQTRSTSLIKRVNRGVSVSRVKHAKV